MFQGFITGFREGLEAFLVLAIMLRYLGTIGRDDLRRYVRLGFGAGVLASAAVGAALFFASRAIAGDAESSTELWASASGLAATGLVTTFILWMIRYGASMNAEVEGNLAARLSPLGVLFLALLLTAREGAEMAVFAFASPEGGSFAAGLGLGAAGAAVLASLLYFSLVRVKLSALFAATTAFLIVQAGFILGYSLHEFLSYAKGAGILDAASPLLVRAYDASKAWGGILDHKAGAIGAPLYAIAGWHSRPEWPQLAAQYAYTAGFITYWLLRSRRRRGA